MLRKLFAIGCVVYIGILGHADYVLAQDNLKDIQLTSDKENIWRKNTLRAAVAPIISPQETLFYYREFMDYVGEKLGMKVKLLSKNSYSEINNLLRLDEVDIAFVCSSPYVDGHDEFGLELLVAPQIRGEVVYYSYLIVPKDSPIKEFEELKGKTFAFTDPLSNSGKLVITYLLAQKQQTADSYFKGYFYTHGNDASIKAVAEGIVDAAAVDSLIWEYLREKDPGIIAKARVIWKSPAFGIPPVVISRSLDSGIKEKIKQIFLSADKEKKGKEILKSMMIDKFVVIDDNAYQSIRQMRDFVENNKKMN